MEFENHKNLLIINDLLFIREKSDNHKIPLIINNLSL